MGSPAQALSSVRLVIGADPGQFGGLVALRVDGLGVAGAVAANLPRGWWARGAEGHPAARIRAALIELVDAADVGLDEVLVVVEAQFSKALEAGGAQQLRDQGMLEGVAAGLGCAVRSVRAQSWRVGTGTASGDYRKNKAASADFCAARLPGLNLQPGRLRTPHTGLADAGAIAWWGAVKGLERWAGAGAGADAEDAP